MAKLIGNQPNQVPTNGDLGDLAYQNKESVTVDNIEVSGTTTTNSIVDTGGTSLLGRRNLIINGAMQVAQRGTSFSGLTSGQYTLDRHYVNMNTLGTWTVSQDTDAPDAFGSSFKLACTSADASPAAGDYLFSFQKFEGQDLQQLKKGTSSAESVTVSFWVKSNKTGDIQVNLLDNDNSRMVSSVVTINSSATWEYKTATFVGDTTGAFDNDNAASMSLEIWYDAGSNFTSGTASSSWIAFDNTNRAAGVTLALGDSTSNYINITGVQLEVGSVATPFEHRSYGEELALCQRYYQTYSNVYVNGSNYSSATGEVLTPMFLKSDLRADPTVLNATTGSGTAGTFNVKFDRVQYLTCSGHTTGGFAVGFDLDAEL